MKSSTGKYYLGLDHVRAVAAFMVFSWHFVHIHDGHHAPPPMFPLSLLTEGHTGVALFMTLSGYLFAKLLDNKKIMYGAFIWNRMLRLAPLLLLIIIIDGIWFYFKTDSIFIFVKIILWGVIKPWLPNGGWSITVEFHFYLILPFLLLLSRKSNALLLLCIGLAIVFRVLLYMKMGEIQYLAYYTIIGRIDQFIFGILAYQFRHLVTGKHIVALGIFLCFAGFYWFFDSLGGYYEIPSPNPIWLIIPTAEGLAYASLIAWYDNSSIPSTGPISRFVALIGNYSYSLYLLHFFFVFEMAALIDQYVIDLSNIYIAMLIAPLAFLMMIPISWASYKFVESPFFKYRKKYIIN